MPRSRSSSTSGSSLRSSQEDMGSTTPSTISRTLVSESTPLLPLKEPTHERYTLSEVRDEIWETLHHAAPIFGTQVLEYSLMLTSVISLGHISTEALAASALGTMTAGVTGLSIITGFACALDSLLPHAWTSGNPQHVGLWTQRMIVLLSIISVPISLLWLNAESILLKLKQEPKVAHMAGVYLQWFVLSLPGQTITVVARRFYQAQGRSHIPTIIMIPAAALNAFLTWLLVWGPDPFRLGFIGAPIASSVSFDLMALAYIIHAYFINSPEAWHPLNHLCLQELGKLFRLGLSSTGQIASEWWCWEIVALAASQLGPISLAAQSVLLTSANVVFMAPFSVSLATSIRVGNALGSGQARKAKLAAETAIGLSVVIAMLISATYMIFRKNWGYMFNNDQEVVDLVAHVIPFLACSQLFDCGTNIMDGILRARGKLAFGAIVNILSYYVFGIPVGISLAFWAGFGLAGLWMGLAAAMFCSATVSIAAVCVTDWDREVAKTRARLGQSDDSTGVIA
ncbi:putative transporter C323,07c OS=Schizosaccharomyces pombe (strain 972 / ATCC 24843) GN=SPAC323.07c PE=1 SV=1 [Rhizoctonia solani AG-1 IB]|uniref:Putative transporter C323,07c n=1 Tax=Thanatephorus cucumeris (strain AG1-IB / isolate 7/3/14) TaxID=1108050 RepID=A0A0B7FZI3_THACB|nr:putative transporter C323,07c OS=Schizosaccharomyces pombe (strain 972 / ATCC 24843) GN=SPAC323.07c PE=1 SV=1 [Rhizoctonia solani AG-1 IB]